MPLLPYFAPTLCRVTVHLLPLLVCNIHDIHGLCIPRVPGQGMCTWQVFKVMTELKTQSQASSFLMTASYQ